MGAPVGVPTLDAVGLYRELHAHPELSMREFQTTARIESVLLRLAAETHTFAPSGVVGVFRNGDGPTVAFRADIDGLPIREETDLPYASHQTATSTAGDTVAVMHACGHDSHVACALGAAQLLVARPQMWHGTAIFILQPGEETAQGARELVDSGLWTKVPRPQVVLGQHLGPFAAGCIRTCPGDVTALADSLKITIRGRGAHGARPELAIDPILTAAYCIVRLQAVVSRGLDPHTPAVLTVGTISGGTKENVIPDEAIFTINLRTPDEVTRDSALEQISRIIEHECAAVGAKHEISPIYSFPRCHNDASEFRTVMDALIDVFGQQNVDLDMPQSMGSEDFGVLAAAIGVPSVFWWYGAYNADQMTATVPPGNHSARFAPDPVLSTEHGISAAYHAMLAYLAVDSQEFTHAKPR